MEDDPIAEVKEPKVDSTLSKGLSILETLAGSSSSMGVTELAKSLELTKSNTFRLLQSLSVLGYVRQNPDKTYAATLKTWQVGRILLDNLNLRELAAPEMKYLSSETGEAIYLAVLEDLSVIYIDKRDSLKPIRSWNPVGGSAPLHCVGTGKAILAQDYKELRPQISGRLTRHTELTLTNLTDLDADMEETRRRGYAYDKGEFRDKILSVGAAVCLPNGKPIAALGISLPIVNMPDKGIDWLGSLVAHAATSVSSKVAKT
ncbi:transcriptional regulator [Tateyamaria omphalii]|uniref:IclR family transcriptional regulator n=1 Tax=Tateyamaria omphalii TaxID=299262 RepID=UPI0019893751|nr:IclR family transcriptional regulator [Tateyamaria omphalii]GGX60251.1 transcriptional regulator [Tateyamaria omphalii]